MNDAIIIGLSGGIGALIGTMISPWIQHNFNSKLARKEYERNLERIKNELVLKEKIESFKKISGLLFEIKMKTINAIMGKGEKNEIRELILELKKESFLFSNKNTITAIKESVNYMYTILDNPSKIIEIEGTNIKINKKELEKITKLISDAQIKILIALRRELKI